MHGNQGLLYCATYRNDAQSIWLTTLRLNEWYNYWASGKIHVLVDVFDRLPAVDTRWLRRVAMVCMMPGVERCVPCGSNTVVAGGAARSLVTSSSWIIVHLPSRHAFPVVVSFAGDNFTRPPVRAGRYNLRTVTSVQFSSGTILEAGWHSHVGSAFAFAVFLLQGASTPGSIFPPIVSLFLFFAFSPFFSISRSFLKQSFSVLTATIALEVNLRLCAVKLNFFLTYSFVSLPVKFS